MPHLFFGKIPLVLYIISEVRMAGDPAVYRIANLGGLEGVVVATILLAQKDALSRNHMYRQSALNYFRSDWYQTHLAFLGLDSTLLPVGIESEAVGVL